MKKSKILNEIHESVTELQKSSLVDEKTMHEFDILCLKDIYKTKPEDIKHLMKKQNIS